MRIDVQKTTLAEWINHWLEIYKKPTVKPHTMETYLAITSHITSLEQAELPLADVTGDDLQIILNELATNNWSKSMLQKSRCIITQAFKTLIRQRKLLLNPSIDLELPLAPTKKVLPLTHDEQTAVELACSNDPLGHLILFLLDTGLRRGELSALQWADYNPKDETIFIPKAKTPAGERLVYLTRRAKEIIHAQSHIGDFIFTNTRGGPVTATVWRRLVERIRKTSGVQHFACHVCRHTFATRLCEHDVSAKSVAQIIGHARSDYTLDIYTQMEANTLRKDILILDQSAKEQNGPKRSVNLPIKQFQTLEKVAQEQHISVDALATYLLASTHVV